MISKHDKGGVLACTLPFSLHLVNIVYNAGVDIASSFFWNKVLKNQSTSQFGLAEKKNVDIGP